MADLSEILNHVTIGTLNEASLERFGLTKDKYSYTSIGAIRTALDSIYEKYLDTTPVGPYKAVCLAAAIDPIRDVPGIRIPSNIFKVPTSGYLIRVIARIEEIHAALPKPVLTGVSKLNSVSERDLSIILHPVFYSIVDNSDQIPAAGNIVSVDFLKQSDKSYGVYLGMVESNVKATMDNYLNARELMASSREQTLARSKVG